MARSFRPAWPISGPHFQTLAGALLRPGRAAPLRRERWELPDGDFLDLDWLEAPYDAPHLLVLHGLEGSSSSGYVRTTLALAQEHGWGAVALNFRSCSGEPNRAFRAYCSGETDDPRAVIERLRGSGISGPLLAIGFSLGANALLKLLAEDGDGSPLTAAAAVSTPFDLSRAADTLDQASRASWTGFYRAHFLKSLLHKARGKAQRHPDRLDPRHLADIRTIRAFDDCVTAPAYGYPDAAAYYAACSSGPLLRQIERPTLLISSRDDPMIPAETLPTREMLGRRVELRVTDQGGHVGFVAGSLLRPSFWAESEAIAFLSREL